MEISACGQMLPIQAQWLISSEEWKWALHTLPVGLLLQMILSAEGPCNGLFDTGTAEFTADISSDQN